VPDHVLILPIEHFAAAIDLSEVTEDDLHRVALFYIVSASLFLPYKEFPSTAQLSILHYFCYCFCC